MNLMLPPLLSSLIQPPILQARRSFTVFLVLLHGWIGPLETVAQNPPARQESQTVAPGRPLNVPAAQGVQVEAPYPELKLPTPHSVHELLPF